MSLPKGTSVLLSAEAVFRGHCFVSSEIESSILDRECSLGAIIDNSLGKQTVNDVVESGEQS